MTAVIKVTSKGQVTLPAAIRRNLRIGEDSYLIAEEVGGFVVLRPLEKAFLELASQFRTEARRRGMTRERLMKTLKAVRRGRRR